jgi:hypothetical protein
LVKAESRGAAAVLAFRHAAVDQSTEGEIAKRVRKSYGEATNRANRDVMEAAIAVPAASRKTRAASHATDKQCVNYLHGRDPDLYGNFLEPETGEFNAGVHWIDVRQRAFFPLELIVGVQLGGDEPRVVPTIVTDCDDEWAADLPRQQGKWIGSGTKRKWVEDESSAFCECLVLPDFEFDRLHALARVEGGSATSAV